MTQALTDLPDDATVSVAIEILASNGIVKGRGESKNFKPKDEINRAEISKIICIAMVVKAIQEAEEEPSPENLKVAQELVNELPPEKGDTSTLDYLTERLEEATAVFEVQVMGLVQLGLKLEAAVEPAHAKVTYQWQSSSSEKGDYTDIAGATQKTYLLDSKDLGRYVRVKVEVGKGSKGSLVSSPRGPVKKLHSTYVMELQNHQRNFVTSLQLPNNEGDPWDRGPTEAELVGNPPLQLTTRASQNNGLAYDRLWRVVTIEEQPPGSEIQLWRSHGISIEHGGTAWHNLVGRYGPTRFYQITPDYHDTFNLYVFANKPGRYTIRISLHEDDGHDDPDFRTLVAEKTITLNFVAP